MTLGHPSRLLVLIASVAMLSGLLVAGGLAAPASACACGGMAPPDGAEVAVGEERAIVSWDGERERIELLLGLDAVTEETGLIFPTPAPATVSLGDRADFEAVAEQTTPRVVVHDDWWSAPSDGASAGAPGGPEVISQVQLGPIEATTLAASDSAGLAAWLAENGYGIAPAVSELLEGYVARGWYFVALKLTSEGALEGGLDPLSFEFATSEPVYPLELSRAATTPQTVRLYLFGERMQQIAFSSDPSTPVAAEIRWAGPVTHSRLLPFGAFLTAVELYLPDPGTQVRGDLLITPAAQNELIGLERQVTRPVGIAGIPLGWLLVGVGLLLAVVVASLVAVRLRRP